jgi:hypothetical protein
VDSSKRYQIVALFDNSWLILMTDQNCIQELLNRERDNFTDPDDILVVRQCSNDHTHGAA